MSRDDGIYILKLSDNSKEEIKSFNYRVIRAHAIENIFSNGAMLFAAFKDAPVTSDISVARELATAMNSEARSDHGILMIDHFAAHDWPAVEKNSVIPQV